MIWTGCEGDSRNAYKKVLTVIAECYIHQMLFSHLSRTVQAYCQSLNCPNTPAFSSQQLVLQCVKFVFSDPSEGSPPSSVLQGGNLILVWNLEDREPGTADCWWRLFSLSRSASLISGWCKTCKSMSGVGVQSEKSLFQHGTPGQRWGLACMAALAGKVNCCRSTKEGAAPSGLHGERWWGTVEKQSKNSCWELLVKWGLDSKNGKRWC